MKLDQPLAGIRVVEFCSVAAGPYGAMLLGDMGADVIKVENPKGGDTLRQWPPITDGDSENFASLNRNKRSVCLDLKLESDRAQARRLVRSAQVLIENNRPGVMARLGLGYEDVSKDNPALVYCSISAFGQSGPRAQEGGFDLTIQAMSGVMSVTGEPGRPPVKCGVPVADFTAGLYAAFAIVSALRVAEETRVGAHIDVPMLGATLAIAALQTSEFFGSGQDPKKLGSSHPRNAPYQAFRARDGYFGMAAGNDGLWRSVCEVVGQREWYDEARFRTTALRARHQDELRERLEVIFATDDCKTWLDRFRQAGVPCAPINSYSEVLEDPQVHHMEWVQPLTLPSGHATRTFASPLKLNGRAAPIRSRPPALGEHSAQVLGGLDAELR